jgi:hypothetical protein
MNVFTIRMPLIIGIPCVAAAGLVRPEWHAALCGALASGWLTP